MWGRHPAKHRQTNEVGTSKGFDQRQFISQVAESYHNERLLSRAMVREIGIQGVDDIVQRRHWEDFLNDPGVANKTLVREFYANLRFMDQQRHTVMVKDTICELICRDNPQWMLSHLNEPFHFPRTTLTFAADNWLRFVSARFLPSPHTSEVTRERAIMIYAILTNVHFDIGHFLHKSILKSAMGGLIVGLYHPSLITELCARADLERQPGDELLQPDSMIHADRCPPRPAGAPVQPRQRQPPPAPGLEERVDRAR
ncbi:hypothetical protein CDL12_18338 [Handroanthus impetiginosus]|uniref:Putative plant transposon protein domain-containing protein n=1 Tax=Handroanthus impetiginosus TaxID=429701 RepID=A0A2G9GV13_9LAMI|nr:hypothetical protein CDL12_18338 [Handroanthus impetiginosus]